MLEMVTRIPVSQSFDARGFRGSNIEICVETPTLRQEKVLEEGLIDGRYSAHRGASRRE